MEAAQAKTIADYKANSKKQKAEEKRLINLQNKQEYIPTETTSLSLKVKKQKINKIKKQNNCAIPMCMKQLSTNSLMYDKCSCCSLVFCYDCEDVLEEHETICYENIGSLHFSKAGSK
jgi:hypothetical protein